MPICKTKMKNAAIAAKSAALPKIPKELLDQFVSGPMTGEAVNAASMAFKKALIERAPGAELGHHLGYTSGSVKPEAMSNQRIVHMSIGPPGAQRPAPRRPRSFARCCFRLRPALQRTCVNRPGPFP
jgi:hypothetical protein